MIGKTTIFSRFLVASRRFFAAALVSIIFTFSANPADAVTVTFHKLGGSGTIELRSYSNTLLSSATGTTNLSYTATSIPTLQLPDMAGLTRQHSVLDYNQQGAQLSDGGRWCTQPNGGGTCYIPGSGISITTNTTFYASWSCGPGYYYKSDTECQEVGQGYYSNSSDGIYRYRCPGGYLTYTNRTATDNLPIFTTAPNLTDCRNVGQKPSTIDENCSASWWHYQFVSGVNGTGKTLSGYTYTWTGSPIISSSIEELRPRPNVKVNYTLPGHYIPDMDALYQRGPFASNETICPPVDFGYWGDGRGHRYKCPDDFFSTNSDASSELQDCQSFTYYSDIDPDCDKDFNGLVNTYIESATANYAPSANDEQTWVLNGDLTNLVTFKSAQDYPVGKSGYYYNNSNRETSTDLCSPVGIGYWSPGMTIPRFQCPTGYTTIGTTSGDMTDCIKTENAADLNSGCASGTRITRPGSVPLGTAVNNWPLYYIDQGLSAGPFTYRINSIPNTDYQYSVGQTIVPKPTYTHSGDLFPDSEICKSGPNTTLVLDKLGGSGVLNGENGTDPTATITCTGTSCLLPRANLLTRYGSTVSYTPAGTNIGTYGQWCTQPNGQGTCYRVNSASGTIYNFASNQTLYVSWGCGGGYYFYLSDTACLPTGKDFFSPEGQYERYPCPEGFASKYDSNTRVTECFSEEVDVTTIDPNCYAGIRYERVTSTTGGTLILNGYTYEYTVQPTVQTQVEGWATADAGYYAPKNILQSGSDDLCIPVGTDYWSPDDFEFRFPCPNGLYTTGQGKGAEFITDCIDGGLATDYDPEDCAGGRIGVAPHEHPSELGMDYYNTMLENGWWDWIWNMGTVNINIDQGTYTLPAWPNYALDDTSTVQPRAGYYFPGLWVWFNQEYDRICEPVTFGFYSPEGDQHRYQCPLNMGTYTDMYEETDLAPDITYCRNDIEPLDAYDSDCTYGVRYTYPNIHETLEESIQNGNIFLEPADNTYYWLQDPPHEIVYSGFGVARAGYYFSGNVAPEYPLGYDDICPPVGFGYWSPEGHAERYPCPPDYMTDNEESPDMTYCYKSNSLSELNGYCTAGQVYYTIPGNPGIIGYDFDPYEENGYVLTPNGYEPWYTYTVDGWTDYFADFGHINTAPNTSGIYDQIDPTAYTYEINNWPPLNASYSVNNPAAAAGYYFTGQINDDPILLCVPVGQGYYSPSNDAYRYICPAVATNTDTITSDNIQDCNKTGTPDNCASGTVKMSIASTTGGSRITSGRYTYIYSAQPTTVSWSYGNITSPLSALANYYVDAGHCVNCSSASQGSDWPYSDGGTGGEEICYANCQPKAIENGIWNPDFAKSSIGFSCEYTIPANIVCDANYFLNGTKCIQSTITLDKLGGSGTINGVSGTAAATVVCTNNRCTLPALTPLTRANSTFTTHIGNTTYTGNQYGSWCTKPFGMGNCWHVDSASGTEYPYGTGAGSTHIPQETTTLYAAWGCNVGYYSTNTTSCSGIVGNGYISPYGMHFRFQCPPGYTTTITNATRMSQCEKTINLGNIYPYCSGTVVIHPDDYPNSVPINNDDINNGWMFTVIWIWANDDPNGDITELSPNSLTFTDWSIPDLAFGTTSESVNITADGGYYYTGNLDDDADICAPVGVGYVSPAGFASRINCPDGFTTLGPTDGIFMNDCMKIENMSDLDANCAAGTLTSTVNVFPNVPNMGYYTNDLVNGWMDYISSNPGNFDGHTYDITDWPDFDVDFVVQNLASKPNSYADTSAPACPLCSSLVGGYNYSAGGTEGPTQCYRDCALAAFAESMTGKDYYGGTTTCAIDECIDNYHINGAVCDPKVYRITFNANGGTGSMTVMNCTYGQTCLLAANGFTKGSDTFIGWSSAQNAAPIYGNGCAISPTSDMTIYAYWYGYAPNLHIGTDSIRLSPTRQTTPALNILKEGTLYYGNLEAAAILGAPKISVGGMEYSIIPDPNATPLMCQ